MSSKYDEQTVEQAKREYDDAYDFDAKDPLFGLRKEELRGPRMTRRSVMRLLAAAGALAFTDVLTACAPSAPSAPAGEAAAGGGRRASRCSRRRVDVRLGGHG